MLIGVVVEATIVEVVMVVIEIVVITVVVIIMVKDGGIRIEKMNINLIILIFHK